ncbi:MAG: DUF2088 domain-containing protein [Spirochaetales bacterium]|nr:DUF2088 domain-containing protein [Spirochaetales bacterium]
MLWIQKGGPDVDISADELKREVNTLLTKLGKREKVLAIPPDITRFHSRAGEITAMLYGYYGERLSDVLPALGTHVPMTAEEKAKMFPGIPDKLFHEHDWRNDPVRVGVVPEAFVRGVSHGAVDFSVPMEVNRLLLEGGHDLILSIGQVVPHEVIGMANHNKNIFVGTGGAECINKSHFLGAAYGMERIMGRADTPVRRVLDYSSENFIADMPIVYILTVIGPDRTGRQVLRGLFAGDDRACFQAAAELSLEVNFNMLEEAPSKMVVYLDPEEFRSTWLGNKSIYRTRMALADGGELLVLAPGVVEFGEDPEIDRLIRKYGYIGREKILELVKTEDELKENLSAAAHLIHGSSDGRFKITYCTDSLSKDEVESAGFQWEDLENVMKKYDPSVMKDGWNTLKDGERVYYISNPALGLWACRSRFEE